MRRGEKAVKSNGRTESNMKKLLILIACMAFLSGCTESTIVKPTAETVVGNPNFETSEDVVIDWKQVSSEAEELFEDTASYPYSKDFRLYLEPKKKEIMLIWVVADDFPDMEICNYAEDLIKALMIRWRFRTFPSRSPAWILTAGSGRITPFPTALCRKAPRRMKVPGLSAEIMRPVRILSFQVQRISWQGFRLRARIPESAKGRRAKKSKLLAKML